MKPSRWKIDAGVDRPYEAVGHLGQADEFTFGVGSADATAVPGDSTNLLADDDEVSSALKLLWATFLRTTTSSIPPTKMPFVEIQRFSVWSPRTTIFVPGLAASIAA